MSWYVWYLFDISSWILHVFNNNTYATFAIYYISYSLVNILNTTPHWSGFEHCWNILSNNYVGWNVETDNSDCNAAYMIYKLILKYIKWKKPPTLNLKIALLNMISWHDFICIYIYIYIYITLGGVWLVFLDDKSSGASIVGPTLFQCKYQLN